MHSDRRRASSPNRPTGSSSCSRGEIRLPDPVPDGFTGYVGSIGLNALEAEENRVWRNSIFVVDGDGNLIDAWTQWDEMFEGGTGPHKIKINPFDPDRKVWVVDETNHQVHAFSNDGSELVMSLGAGGAGDDETHFNRPQDVAFLEDGSIFVADSDNSRVVKLDAEGSFVTSWGVQGSGRGEFDAVHAVATDSIGRILRRRPQQRPGAGVQRDGPARCGITRTSRRSPTWPGFEFPNDIYATGYEVWIADNMPTRMVKLDWNGNPLFEFDAAGEGPGQFPRAAPVLGRRRAQLLRRGQRPRPGAEVRAGRRGRLHRADGAAGSGTPVVGDRGGSDRQPGPAAIRPRAIARSGCGVTPGPACATTRAGPRHVRQPGGTSLRLHDRAKRGDFS